MDDQACPDRVFADLLGIGRWTQQIDARWRRCTAAARHHLGAARRRVHIHATAGLERLDEVANSTFIGRVDDQVEGVFPFHHCLRVDLDTVLMDTRGAEVVEKRRTHIRVLGRAALRIVLMMEDEERHRLSLRRLPLDRQFLLVPVEHSALEIRDLLEAKPAEHCSRGGTPHSSPADCDHVLVLVRS